MVFKVKRHENDSVFSALKVIRKKVSIRSDQSSFSSEELDALKELSHANIVRLSDVIKKDDSVVAVCTSYIENAQGIDSFIQDILNDPIATKNYCTYGQISQERLDNTCRTVIKWIYKVSTALEHMHSIGYYHMDIKPTNILLHGHKKNVYPVITDLGSCVKNEGHASVRVHFTWAYAHPDLTDINSDSSPGSIEGGAIRASATVSDMSKLPIYDLYALGKSIQQILAVIELHFRENCHSNYFFKYLHIISALLLDGKNKTEGEREKESENIFVRHGIRFIMDFPMELSQHLLDSKKITSASELVSRLKRYRDDYSIIELAHEFKSRNSIVINNTVGDVVPFTKRVSMIFEHPAVKRLYNEKQLGLMAEIYPGASHNRWSHSIGVYAIVLKYYISLLSDPVNPLMRIITNDSDVSHALLAAILHDIGHTDLCHDLEYANKDLFDHISYFDAIISEKFDEDTPTFSETIDKYWGNNVDIKRVYSIITHTSTNIIDYVASDCVNSPIDADKLDYIKRDSYYCGVSYGDGIDCNRIVSSLTVVEKDKKLRLAYYFKGRTAVASMLLARYQLYGSVYWHHTHRCLHAMVLYATQLAFGKSDSINYRVNVGTRWYLKLPALRKLYFYRVICKYSWEESWDKLKDEQKYLDYNSLNIELRTSAKVLANDFSLDFVYRFTDENGRKLLECVKKRTVFKRIYTTNLKDVEMTDLISKCDNKVQVSKDIQTRLLSAAIDANAKESEKSKTATEMNVSKELLSYKKKVTKDILVLVDFPQKIKIPVKSWPQEVADSARKLQNYGGNDAQEIINSTNNLSLEVASLRVFAEPFFYQLITRYLSARKIEDCVKDVIDVL